MIGVCAALYAVIGRLTDFGVTLGGVAFWPAAVIPAVFAVLFGPLTGGVGAGIGIFIRDMLYHGDPLLSLTAGVPANVVGILLIGFISRTRFDWKKLIVSAVIGSLIIATGILLPTVLLPSETLVFTGLSFQDTMIVFAVTVIASIAVILVAAKIWSEWRNYAVGSVIGLGVASAMIAVIVWIYSQIFFSPTGYFKSAIPSSFIPIIFVWTFATEIPFVLLVGPIIIKVVYKAYPSLKMRPSVEETKVAM
jgi:uncharacterized membrane protein